MKSIPTKDSVIIEPIDFDKASASQHVFGKYPEIARPDFLFVAGNDRSDEGVFRWAKQLKEEWTVPNVQTVTVGDRNSIAMSTLTNGTTGKHPFSYTLDELLLRTTTGLLGALSKLAKTRGSS